jgi:hypothetical protein
MSELLKPPVIPSVILNFFSGQPDFSAVAGDIAEEFQKRAASAGADAAKRWYWRESFRNSLALTWRELCRTPVRTMAFALTGLLVVNAVCALYVSIGVQPLSVVLAGHWDPIELVLNHGQRDAFLLLQFAVSLGMGWVGGKRLPGREWAVALLFAFISVCLPLPMALYLGAVEKIVVPKALWEFMIVGLALRLIGFGLGSLWIRQSGKNRPFAERLS